jgi:hypothetical protein
LFGHENRSAVHGEPFDQRSEIFGIDPRTPILPLAGSNSTASSIDPPIGRRD